ncbi:MAG TPA: outer membrane beta-barrel protein [Anaeromyxobacter sp.]|nr:outer membrane beta-barrel protein [Anaeromyxobacter sp.]
MTMAKGARTGLRALAGLLALVLAPAADAGPGNGIRLGGSAARLHPYLELEGRYDSNLVFTEEGEQEAGFILHVRPGLTLASPSERAAVDFRAHLDWAQYLGESSDLSRLFGDAALSVGLNRRGSLGLELTDVFRRSSSTRNLTLGYAVVSNTNDLRVSVPFRPGGGAFVTTLTGGWRLETFEPFVKGNLCEGGAPECDADQAAQLDYSDVTGGLDLRWKFLPKTAAVLQGEYWRRLPSDPDAGLELSGYRGWAGVAGLFSAHLAGTLRGGYGSASLSPGSISTWLANAEVEWIPLETASVKAGYLHDLGADPGAAGAYTSHRGYADARALLAARYTVQLVASYERRAYQGVRVVEAADLLTVTPSVDVELARWLTAGAGVSYSRRTSELAAGTRPLPGYAYSKTEAFLRVRGTY